MNPEAGTGGGGRRPRRPARAIWLVLAAAASAGAASQQAALADEPAASARPGTAAVDLPASAAAVSAGPVAAAVPASLAWPSAAIGLSALALGAALALRLAGRQARLDAELRQARSRVASLESLLDAWFWQTDAEHRLVTLRPPAGTPPAAWPAAPALAALPSRMRGGDSAALGALLAGAATIEDLPVEFDPGGQGHLAGVLCARPLVDADARFAGHVGTFRVREAPVKAAAPAVPPGAAPSRPSDAAPGAPAPAPAPAPAVERIAAADHESFSFTVSHDLRAPIRVVEGFTKIVKEDYGRLLDRVGNDHLDRVLGAAARMNNMIDALLALSKLSSQPLLHQPVNLSQLAGYVVDDLRRQWPEHQVSVEIEPGMQVLGDPTLLRVVIENLLGNAWKYTGKSTRAEVAFGRHPEQPDVFSVVDNGAGFDMRFADRLFGVFQRLHSANDFPGTGVGLASVRRIVRRHGGEIWGEAEVNRGARFHFSLPSQAGRRPVADADAPSWDDRADAAPATPAPPVPPPRAPDPPARRA